MSRHNDDNDQAICAWVDSGAIREQVYRYSLRYNSFAAVREEQY
jgi:hypothetical protein